MQVDDHRSRQDVRWIKIGAVWLLIGIICLAVIGIGRQTYAPPEQPASELSPRDNPATANTNTAPVATSAPEPAKKTLRNIRPPAATPPPLDEAIQSARQALQERCPAIAAAPLSPSPPQPLSMADAARITEQARKTCESVTSSANPFETLK